MPVLTDTLSRPLRDLRISVTDRCNFRCTYCMPAEVFGPDYRFLPHPDLLTFDEVGRLAGIFVDLGAEKLRVTGGEPLVRPNVDELVRKLAAIDGVRDLTMTTNGAGLPAMVERLKDAGLQRVTISLDSLDDATFQRINGVGFPVSRVLAGIDAALAAGLAPIKINMVVQRGVNEQDVLPMARRFHGTTCTVRFIEYMDVGTTNGWSPSDVVPADEIVAAIDREMPLEPVAAAYTGEVAGRYRYKDGGGEIGVISSITRPFCRDCTRARLSADGRLYTCLFATDGTDLRTPLRAGAADTDLAALIGDIWRRRADRYSEVRTIAHPGQMRVEMSRIGG